MARVIHYGPLAVALCATLSACDPTLLLNEFCATDDDCTNGRCDARGVCDYEAPSPQNDAGIGEHPDAGETERDSGVPDSADADSGPTQGDAGQSDGGHTPTDAGQTDGGQTDGGQTDSGATDGGMSAPPDGGAQDAGPSSWQLLDDDAADFAAGSSSGTVPSMNALQLGPGQLSGSFDSRPLVTGTPESELQVLTPTMPAPFGRPLPDNVLNNNDVTAWSGNGFDLSAAIILLHFDRPLNETVSVMSTAADTTGYNGSVSFVDNPPLENSVYEPGPLHNAVHIAFEDYFVLEDSDDATRWAFGNGGFTWAVWMKADGCENSEDNIIALGGEQPHMWLGALCSSGNAQFRPAGGGAAVGAVNVVDNTWHHLAGVFNPELALATKLYVDGALVAEEAGDIGTAGNFTKKLLMGNFPIGISPLYNYKSDVVLDELVVLRRAASADEIAHLYQRGGTSVRFQIEVCVGATNCLGTFRGPDLTADTYYESSTNVSPGPAAPFVLSPGIPGSVFRYRATFHRVHTTLVPALQSVALDAATP